jgi:hypothetical protein
MRYWTYLAISAYDVMVFLAGALVAYAGLNEVEGLGLLSHLYGHEGLVYYLRGVFGLVDVARWEA